MKSTTSRDLQLKLGVSRQSIRRAAKRAGVVGVFTLAGWQYTSEQAAAIGREVRRTGGMAGNPIWRGCYGAEAASLAGAIGGAAGGRGRPKRIRASSSGKKNGKNPKKTSRPKSKAGKGLRRRP